MRLGSLTILSILLLVPVAASAQALGGTGSSDPFTVSVSPQYPAPLSSATLSLTSSTLDLVNSTMTVLVAGKQIYQGNVQPTSVALGKAGVVTVITVRIVSGGTPYSQTITLQPQDVSIIAEPVASAPVLYPGRPLVPLQGGTRVVAIANFKDAGGKTLDPATLSYDWTVDGMEIASESGIGKDALMVASPLQYRERDVSVAVQDQNGGLVGGASLTLDPVEPTVRIYENDPLLGIRFNHALASSYAISGSEATLYAAPFSLPLTGPAPIIQWFLNGVAAQTGSSITLRPSGNGQGSVSLSLTASAGSDSNEATANLPISFGTTPSTNFFGL